MTNLNFWEKLKPQDKEKWVKYYQTHFKKKFKPPKKQDGECLK